MNEREDIRLEQFRQLKKEIRGSEEHKKNTRVAPTHLTKFCFCQMCRPDPSALLSALHNSSAYIRIANAQLHSNFLICKPPTVFS